MVRAQRNGDVVWVSSLSTSTEFMDSWNESDTESQLLTPQELCQAQHEDQAIGQVIRYKQQGKFPEGHERQNESHGTRVLMRSWRQLELGDDGILRR